MADTFVKNPVLYKGTKAQIESATMGENDFAVATDAEFYTKEEVDSLIAGAGGGLESVTHDASLTGAGTADSPLAIAPTVTAQINSKADQTAVDTLTGEVSDLMADVSAVEADVMGKVAIAQGTENAGKILKVDDNGNVTTGEMPANFPILSHMWADHLLNDPSWVHSGSFVWQSGDYYVAAYEHLYNDIVRPMYCWGTTYYSYTETPSVGDTIYYRGEGSYTTVEEVGDGYIVVKDTRTGLSVTIDRNASNDSTSIAIGMGRKTETTGGVTITYYQADDGHKICTADQESNLVALYEKTGVAWYYILDTENKQFKLPRTKYGFTGLRDSVGGYVAPAVPNITAGFRTGSWKTDAVSANTSGAASQTYGSGAKAYESGSNAYTYVDTTIDASASDPTYQDGATVQPPATQMYLYFYVGNFEKESIEQTAGITSEILNAKADVVSVANLALPSSRFIDLTLPASEGNYYAPADGYFYVQKVSTAGSTNLEYLNIYNRTAGNIAMTATNAKSAGTVVQAWVPARKGDRIQPVYNLGGETRLCRFVYAQSAQ